MVSVVLRGSRTTNGLTPVQYYEEQLKKEGFSKDPTQQMAMGLLQKVFDDLQKYNPPAVKSQSSKKSGGFLSNLFGGSAPKKDKYSVNRPVNAPKGLYLWGGVGRGKSFLMDSFFACLPEGQKRRVHFHSFMQEVHQEMKTIKGVEDPLEIVEQRIYQANPILCFDEFHVSDIADAMILARLLRFLFEYGIVFVMTSNYKPDDLYPNGLQRINFLPAIALINQYLEVANVDSGVDYRLRTLEKVEIYHSPLDAQAITNMTTAFEQLTQGQVEIDPELEIQSRKVKAVKATTEIVWFDFKSICGDGRGQSDYLELAQEFHTILLSNIPKLGIETSAEARRFTWLVDVFYDHRVKLIISAEVPPEELYTNGPHSGEFFRTVSRLQEMQSKDYLSQAHIVD